jgi:hypothetical protein
MDRMVASGLFAFALFIGMLILLNAGRRIRAQHLASDRKGAPTGTGTIEAAVFALLGLLIASIFSGAVSRFDARRHLIEEEANAIGTVYLRLDLLSANTQPALAGYGMAGGESRRWLHGIGFALVIGLTVYVILDIDFPRSGLIRVDAFDQVLVDLLQSMK